MSDTDGGNAALTATALSPGSAGNKIVIDIDYGMIRPPMIPPPTQAKPFNLTVTQFATVNGTTSAVATEVYQKLVQDKTQANDALATVNAASGLIALSGEFASTRPAQTGTDQNAGLRSRNAALYFPCLDIPDPLNAFRLRKVAPSGTIAGLWARTDAQRGVWKAPAGTAATLTGVQGLEYLLTDPENGVLNPLAVNCFRNFPIYGAVSWGARTLFGADQIADDYKYIPVRRLALFLEESLYRGLKWVVFEPNDNF